MPRLVLRTDILDPSRVSTDADDPFLDDPVNYINGQILIIAPKMCIRDRTYTFRQPLCAAGKNRGRLSDAGGSFGSVCPCRYSYAASKTDDRVGQGDCF